MSQDHMLDLKFMFGCKFHIALDVTLGIDDGGSAGLLVTDQVRSVSEAIEIELLEDHVSLDLFEAAKQYHIAERVLREMWRHAEKTGAFCEVLNAGISIFADPRRGFFPFLASTILDDRTTVVVRWAEQILV
jgi:hypothetical protein